MRPIEFVQSKKSALIINIIGMSMLYSYLRIFSIPQLAVAFIVIFWAVVFIIYLSIEYVMRNRYYKKLKDFIENSRDLNTLTYVVEPPDSPDMHLLYNYIQILNRDIQEKMYDIKSGWTQYQEYVESWVHEIKIPIASLKLIIDTGIEGNSRDELIEELDKIEYLIDQTLYFARSESVEKDYLVSEFPVMKCVKAAIIGNSSYLKRCNVRVDIKNSGETVYSDEKWLVFILNQIIVNSIKYRKKDDPYIKIWVDTKDNCVHLNIEDNGIGISKEDLPRIFDKGFTGSTGRQYEKSTGIGLYLVKKLCLKLGLGVYADSVQGLYTKITIVFPKGKFANF